jgi:glycosyltransferase involved in cell wall biosynthesis
MRVAVITPYYKEDLNTLARCHKSVVAQTYKDVTHFMVADGFPRDYVDTWECEHIKLPNCADTGDTPRVVGYAVASARGFDAICFLDADCWLEPQHISEMVDIMKSSGCAVVTCPRNLYHMDGTFMAVDKESDGRAFNDTNCYLIHRNAYMLIHAWIQKPPGEGLIGDRYFWFEVCKSGVPMARAIKPTVNYTTTFAFHYELNGLPVPDHAKVIADLGDGYKTYNHKEVIRV